MAESEKVFVFNTIRDVLAKDCPSGQQRPRHPEDVALHNYMSLELQDNPAVKSMLKELVDHPELLDADVRAYRDHVEKNGHWFEQPAVQERPKSSARAAEIRGLGNLLYAMGDHAYALEKYNESICFAPNDSEDLSIGYANRSAVFYGTGEYKLALANIALAKKHNYPERLMPKLLARETDCRKMIDDLGKHAVRFPTLPFNVEANPRIPFLAKGIFARKLPAFGKSMLAEKDFKAGDVILREKPMKVSVSFRNKYFSCNHCLAENMFHLIPCPNCASVMFCDEECRAEAQKIHRFECGISAELSHFNDFWAGPRMFFHGLTLFGDDVKKMMKFSRANKETGRSFFDLDYSNYDPREEFKAFLGPQAPTKILKPGYDNMLQFNSAIIYTMYMKVPLVRSLFTGKVQKDFMLQSFFDNMALANGMSVHQSFDGQLYPIASCFGHSKDPNAVAVNGGGQLKLIVLRPIRRGERILVSYGPSCEEQVSERHARLRALGLECQCRLCDEKECQEWLAKVPKGKTIVPAHLETVKRVMAAPELNNADKLNALQQFIQRYAGLHPQEDLSTVLSMYRCVLTVTNENELKAALRQKTSV